jgi:hypothetical protein
MLFTPSDMPAAGQPCGHSCGERIMNIFYIIGVVVVVAVILGYLGLA